MKRVSLMSSVFGSTYRREQLFNFMMKSFQEPGRISLINTCRNACELQQQKLHTILKGYSSENSIKYPMSSKTDSAKGNY